MPSIFGINIAGSVVLDDRTVSNVAAIEFTKFTSFYSKYIWLLQDIIPATDFRNAAIRTTADGSSFDNGASDYSDCQRSVRDDNSVTLQQAATRNFIRLNTNGIGGVSAGFGDEGYSGYIVFYKPNDARYTNVFFEVIYRNSFNQSVFSIGSGTRLSTTSVVGAQFFIDSGNVSGRLTMLGFE